MTIEIPIQSLWSLIKTPFLLILFFCFVSGFALHGLILAITKWSLDEAIASFVALIVALCVTRYAHSYIGTWISRRQFSDNVATPLQPADDVLRPLANCTIMLFAAGVFVIPFPELVDLGLSPIVWLVLSVVALVMAIPQALKLRRAATEFDVRGPVTTS